MVRLDIHRCVQWYLSVSVFHDFDRMEFVDAHLWKKYTTTTSGNQFVAMTSLRLCRRQSRFPSHKLVSSKKMLVEYQRTPENPWNWYYKESTLTQLRS